MRLQVEVVGADRTADLIQSVVVRLTPGAARPVLRQIADHWASEVFPGLFDRGGDPPWPKHAKVSEKLRGPSRLLAGSGDLRASIKVLDVGDREASVGAPFGIQHQQGGRTAGTSMIPDKEIPARPFIDLGAADIDDAAERLEQFYFEGVQ